jgi:hypothetical protein
VRAQQGKLWGFALVSAVEPPPPAASSQGPTSTVSSQLVAGLEQALPDRPLVKRSGSGDPERSGGASLLASGYPPSASRVSEA